MACEIAGSDQQVPHNRAVASLVTGRSWRGHGQPAHSRRWRGHIDHRKGAFFFSPFQRLTGGGCLTLMRQGCLTLMRQV